MTTNGPDDPSDTPPKPDRQPDQARNLFGHKSGAKGWETPAGQAPTEEAAKPDDTSSAPYPRDAQYTPRPEAPPEGSSILGEVDDEGELTLLHPNYKLVMRVGALLAGLAIMIAALIIDGGLRNELDTPFGIISGPALIIAIIIGFRVPVARYNARGYQISRDRLRVVRGVWWHSDTIVPFGRVQHIDVDQGPLERALGIATMTLHTAGSHNASVRLPGLGHELAVEMREAIRAHIKRESM
ncbi:PH domain-containing protein [uncultured Erythrobacter sp.]|uniref:PH domain-containing protein n=1 Tax=uncultured Erythrobacter sp. TaxID=263913 RepID=UPI002619C5E0|nr:PH domain-containing protein [uncultured Erythrobacter sp.]